MLSLRCLCAKTHLLLLDLSDKEILKQPHPPPLPGLINHDAMNLHIELHKPTGPRMRQGYGVVGDVCIINNAQGFCLASLHVRRRG